MAALDLGTSETDALSLTGADLSVAYACGGALAASADAGASLSFVTLALSSVCSPVSLCSASTLSGRWIVAGRCDAVSSGMAALAGPVHLSAAAAGVSASLVALGGELLPLGPAVAAGVSGSAAALCVRWSLSGQCPGLSGAAASLRGLLVCLEGAASMLVYSAVGELGIAFGLSAAAAGVSAPAASLRVSLAFSGSAAGVSGSGARVTLPFFGSCAGVSGADVPALYCPVALEGFCGPDSSRRPQLAGLSAGVSSATAWLVVSRAPNVFLEGA